MNFQGKLIKPINSINDVILKIISQVALVFSNLLFGKSDAIYELDK